MKARLDDIHTAALMWQTYEGPEEARTAYKRYISVLAGDGGDSGESELSVGSAAWFWAEDGFWSLTCGHKYAAALMLTQTGGARGELLLPGRVVRVVVPDGLLPVRYVWVVATPSSAGVVGLVALNHEWIGSNKPPPPARVCYVWAGVGIDEALFGGVDDDLATAFGPGTETGLGRIEKVGLMARRLVVGLLCAMQHSANFRERSYPTNTSRGGPRTPPAHRNVVVGAPIVFDARPQLAEWMLGNKRSTAAPSLQHIVRGHYRRQVVGVGRSGRKVLWVEPYWRGPEGAPILLHERKAGVAP